MKKSFLFPLFILWLSQVSYAATMPSEDIEFQCNALKLVNDYRKLNRIPRLKLNTHLVKAALAHSKDQADHNMVSHDGSDGSDERDRLTRQKFYYDDACENVAGGGSFIDAAKVIEAWKASPAHNACLLNRDLREAGFGFSAQSKSSYKNHWTFLAGSQQEDNAFFIKEDDVCSEIEKQKEKNSTEHSIGDSRGNSGLELEEEAIDFIRRPTPKFNFVNKDKISLNAELISQLTDSEGKGSVKFTVTDVIQASLDVSRKITIKSVDLKKKTVRITFEATIKGSELSKRIGRNSILFSAEFEKIAAWLGVSNTGETLDSLKEIVSKGNEVLVYASEMHSGGEIVGHDLALLSLPWIAKNPFMGKYTTFGIILGRVGFGTNEELGSLGSAPDKAVPKNADAIDSNDKNNLPMANTVVFLESDLGNCTGTMISPSFVLTAAHCFKSKNSVKVRRNANSEAYFKVSDARKHWQYEKAGDFGDNDLALVKLAHEMPSEFTSANLATLDNKLELKNALTTYGFAIRESQAKGSEQSELFDNRLKAATFFVIASKDAGSIPGIFNSPTSEQTRVILTKAKGRSTCNGDSGGPTFLRDGQKYLLIGVNSAVSDINCENSMNIMVDIRFHRDWVDATMKEMGSHL